MSSLERRASLVIAAAALCGALAPAPPEAAAKTLPGPLAANIPLAREQLKLIDQITSDLDRLYKNGELSLTAPSWRLWAWRRVEALRATGAAKDAMVAELERYFDFMTKQEAGWKSLHDRDQATRADVLAAQYERLEAQMLLNQEKAR
jgi:hypothetical protein